MGEQTLEQQRTPGAPRADLRATMKDVARLAQVSSRTVSNVINGHPHVTDSTRRRVLAAIEELAFTPDPVAQALRGAHPRFSPLSLDRDDPRRSADVSALLLAHALELDMKQGSGPHVRPICLLALGDG